MFRRRTFRRRRPNVRRPARRAPVRTLVRRRAAPRRNLPLSGFPVRSLVRLRYADTIILTPATSGDTALYFFRANGCHDPDISSTGHQPYGYDQWSTVYNHACVYGSKITVEFAPSSGNINQCGVFLADDTTTSVDPDTLSEQKSACQRCVVTQMPRSITCTYSAKKTLGPSADTNRSLVQQNPADAAVFAIWTSGLNPSVTGAQISARVIIEYVVLFTELKELPPS